MIHNYKNREDLPPCKKGICGSGLPYHISERVLDQNGNICWFNYKYDKWCFADGIEREVIWWKEIVPPSEPMRSLNKEEQKKYSEAINKVYKPTGAKLFDKESE